MSAIPTPCVRLCTFDDLAGVCVGCGRTLAEIGGWMKMSDSERLHVMAALPARLLALHAGQRPLAVGER